MGELLHDLAGGGDGNSTFLGRRWGNPRLDVPMPRAEALRPLWEIEAGTFQDAQEPGAEGWRALHAALTRRACSPVEVIERRRALPGWEHPGRARFRPYRTYAGIPDPPPGAARSPEEAARWRAEALREGWAGCDWFDATSEDDMLCAPRRAPRRAPRCASGASVFSLVGWRPAPLRARR